MIPKIIHYCWFGRGPMSQLALDCIESWHKYMPDWEYKLWNEDNFDVNCNQYVREAYEAKKYAFVTDYVRLYALKTEGGVYMDTDVKLIKSLDPLLDNAAFCGFEESKTKPIGTCVMASIPNGKWIQQMLNSYSDRKFIDKDGHLDLTTNTTFLSGIMEKNGLKRDGLIQQYLDCTVYSYDYFSPGTSTGEYCPTENTFCHHLCVSSWSDAKNKYSRLKKLIGSKNMTRLIKLKRKLIG